MATVTGMTAAAMIAIRDDMVVSGTIDGSGNLILTTYDGTTINAGSIPTAVGSASTTAAGLVELATSAETSAGTDAVRAVTPAGLLTVTSGKQPLDDDLTAIANISPANDDFIQRKSGVWVNRTLAQVAADLVATSAMAASDTQKGVVELATSAEVATGTDTARAITPAGLAALVSSDTVRGLVELATSAEVAAGADTARAVTPAGLASVLSGKQAADSDLTAIAGLTPTANDVMQYKAGAWANRTIAQLITDILAAGSVQPIDSDLTAIAAIAPSNDDVIQRKAGAWINRTMAQLLVDILALPLAGGTMTGTTNGTLSASTVAMIAALVGGDTFDRMRLYTDGLEMGDGTSSRDVKIARTAAAMVSLTGGDFRVATVGKGLRVATGTNAKMGTATLVAGTVTVSNTSVTANSHIVPYHVTAGGTQGWLKASKVAGTSLTITSSSSSDTSVVGYLILEPA